MKNESLSTSMMKLIMTVSLIIGVGAVMGLMGWLVTNISKINIPIVTAPVEKNVTIAINKIENEQGEIIKTTIRNNLDNSIWYYDDIYCYLEFNSGNAWAPSIIINMTVCPRGEIKELDSNQEISYNIDFSNYNNIFYSGAGKYRISFKYNYSLENVGGRVSYSNEFTIKEKTALDARCYEKAKAINRGRKSCTALGRGIEFNLSEGKCIAVNFNSACSVESPFETSEECQEVCEEEEKNEIAVIEKVGRVYVVGNEPFTNLALEVEGDKTYCLIGPKFDELWNLQGKDVIVKGNIDKKHGCFIGKTIFVTSFIIKEEVKDDTADWQTYRNEKYGFELKYPLNWKYIETEYETIVFGEYVPAQDYPFIVFRRISEKDVTGKMFKKDSLILDIHTWGLGNPEEYSINQQILSSFKFIEKDEMKILSPVEGEIWKTGERYDISWTPRDKNSKIDIRLYDNDAPSMATRLVWQPSSVTNTGKFKFDVFEELKNGNRYQFSITEFSDNDSYNVQSGEFSIVKE